jgi:hypothetical protein
LEEIEFIVTGGVETGVILLRTSCLEFVVGTSGSDIDENEKAMMISRTTKPASSSSFLLASI